MISRSDTSPANGLLGRARRLRARRGAAMVEGVVAIPFFILIFMGAMFAGGFYGKRIETQGMARNETWKRAGVESCDNGFNGELEGMEIVDSADLGALSESPLVALCDEKFGSITYTARDSHQVTSNLGTLDGEVMAAIFVPCNESAIGGDAAYKAAVEYLWSTFQDNGMLPGNAQPPALFDWSQLIAFGGLGGVTPMPY